MKIIKRLRYMQHLDCFQIATQAELDRASRDLIIFFGVKITDMFYALNYKSLQTALIVASKLISPPRIHEAVPQTPDDIDKAATFLEEGPMTKGYYKENMQKMFSAITTERCITKNAYALAIGNGVVIEATALAYGKKTGRLPCLGYVDFIQDYKGNILIL